MFCLLQVARSVESVMPSSLLLFRPYSSSNSLFTSKKSKDLQDIKQPVAGDIWHDSLQLAQFFSGGLS